MFVDPALEQIVTATLYSRTQFDQHRQVLHTAAGFAAVFGGQFVMQLRLDRMQGFLVWLTGFDRLNRLLARIHRLDGMCGRQAAHRTGIRARR